MKTIEINGQKVLAVNVPMDAENIQTNSRGRLYYNFSFTIDSLCSMTCDYQRLPKYDYTIFADSGEPKKFVKVFYPDAKIVVWEGAFAKGIIGGCKVLTQRGGTESEMWQSAASRIMQENGLEDRIVLLTEKS